MKTQYLLFYNGEEIDQLTELEENNLSETLVSTKRPASIKWKGNTVETRKLIIRKRGDQQQDRRMSDHTKQELTEIVGNFEDEYNKNDSGPMVRSGILGVVSQGIINYAIRFGAITKRFEEMYGGDMYYIHLPQYYDYEKKYNAMQELRLRREPEASQK